MIRHITVDGFKTLDEFKMELRPGLNILVGPNGSGKTNIISFFEFLGFLQHMNVADAISSAGGAGSIFQKIGENSYIGAIRSEIAGIARLGSRNYIYYQYSFVISLRESGESIVYSQQKLKLKFRTVDSTKRLGRKYDLHIELHTDGGLKPKPKIVHLSAKTLDLFNSRYLGKKHSSAMDEMQTRLSHLLANSDPDETIISSTRFIDRTVWSALHNDIKGGQNYNIEPSKAKMADDSSKKAGVSKDGSGLYSTLYAHGVNP